MKKTTLSILGFLLLLMSGCQKTDVTPAYIIITDDNVSLRADKVDLQQFNSTSGLTSHSFPYMWVTVDGEKLGIWEVPCEIPVLASGNVIVEVLPGVEMNGMSTTCPEYPFVSTFKDTVYLEKGKSVTVKPQFQYYGSNLYFPLVENFESAGTSFAPTDTADKTYIQKIDDADLIYHDPYIIGGDNRFSGYIHLSNPDSVKSFRVACDYLSLPGSGNSVFLELNYKCDHDLYVSLLVRQSSSVPSEEALIGLRSTNGVWKKAYVNLTLAVSRNTSATGFKVVLTGATNDSNDDTANYYFDNIRVLYTY